MSGLVVDPFVVMAASLHFDRGAYAVLAGSGMSTAAGIPTGWDLTMELAELEALHHDGRIPDDIEAWWAANKAVPLWGCPALTDRADGLSGYLPEVLHFA